MTESKRKVTDEPQKPRPEDDAARAKHCDICGRELDPRGGVNGSGICKACYTHGGQDLVDGITGGIL